MGIKRKGPALPNIVRTVPDAFKAGIPEPQTRSDSSQPHSVQSLTHPTSNAASRRSRMRSVTLRGVCGEHERDHNPTTTV